MSMDDILSDTPAAQEPAPAAPEPTPAPPEPVPEPTPAPAAPEPEPIDETTGMSPKEKAFYTKAQDEKRKRQELEREIQELRGRNTPQQPPQEKKEFWEDPEGNLKTYEERMRQIAVETRLNTSEQIARSKYDDFDEKVNIFKAALDRAPWLFEEAKKSANPAEFVYKTAKNYQELQQAGDLDTVRKNMEQELRVKLEAEFKAKEEAKRKELDEIPKSLSEVRNTGVNRPVWNGPEPLDSILKG